MSPLRSVLQVDLASVVRFAWSSNRLDARMGKHRVLVHVERQAETPRLYVDRHDATGTASHSRLP